MKAGTVYLVGAGPGDPGLITVEGLRLLQEADLVVYDRLVAPSLLAHCRPEAELIYVGKAGGDHTLPQDEINALLVARAREGKRVVRLKGGDPFVFGRGGEEAEVLTGAGIPFVVVPGVTAAVAAAAYAGIPVTHRRYASSFAVITGHEDAAKETSSIAWSSLAAIDTLVILMGTRSLPDVAERLLAGGRPPSTPVAVVHWGTTPRQRTVVGTLADIAGQVQSLPPPTVVVIGEVVRLRETLNWFENRPLFGKRVLVTRARHQASVLARLLADEGAEVIELPALEIRPTVDEERLAQAIRCLAGGEYSWAVFTSANAVEVFFAHLRQVGYDARAFGGARVCAIGPATAQALEERGIHADAVPEEYIAEGVVAALAGQVASGQRVLVPRAEGARQELVDGLAALGARVDEMTLYRAEVPEEALAEALARLRGGEVDIVTFTSSSTVRNLVQLLGGDVESLRQSVIACIGPVTAQTAEELLGRKPDLVAREHTMPGLVRALAEYYHWV
ncbi:MAG TPA: uroporphyrinogen-III C-methyltransferase [Dehalococcoidia bacterium]|nr:uroporphyrinogen-III C-methyltransferase [Dehalococcoidia bacterium]